MFNIFVPKFNFYNWKIILSITLFCVIYSYLPAQDRAARKAEKRQEQLKKEREEEFEKSYRKALDHQLEIQGKQAQKRMKKDKKIIDNYYNKKLDNSSWKKYWFNRNRKKKS